MLGLLNVFKVSVIMVTELKHGKVEINTLENGKMAKDTDKELKHNRSLDQNTLEKGKMVYQTDKELTYFLVEKNTLENLKMAKKLDMAKDLSDIQMDLYLLEHLQMVYPTEKEL